MDRVIYCLGLLLPLSTGICLHPVTHSQYPNVKRQKTLYKLLHTINLMMEREVRVLLVLVGLLVIWQGLQL